MSCTFFRKAVIRLKYKDCEGLRRPGGGATFGNRQVP